LRNYPRSRPFISFFDVAQRSYILLAISAIYMPVYWRLATYSLLRLP